MDAPGVKKEDISVEIKGETMKIEMHKKGETTTDTEQLHRVERYSGMMKRIIPLPSNIVEDKISCTYTDGVLHIDLPKVPGLTTETENVKQIEVK